jgi:hypothetical protein
MISISAVVMILSEVVVDVKDEVVAEAAAAVPMVREAVDVAADVGDVVDYAMAATTPMMAAAAEAVVVVAAAAVVVVDNTLIVMVVATTIITAIIKEELQERRRKRFEIRI